MPFSLLKVIIIIIIIIIIRRIIIRIIIRIKSQNKDLKKLFKKKLTLGDLTNKSVPDFPIFTINTTKHAPFAITGPYFVYESCVVYTSWLPLSPFVNSQRSSIHPRPIPAFFVKPTLHIFL